MKKIEIIWRELLFRSIEKENRKFTQKALAEKFGFSTSTVFQALQVPRQMGACRVTGRFFILEDPRKLLYHWASVRNLQKEIILGGRVNLPIMEVEGLMPADVIFGSFSAARQFLGEAAADYDQVWVYVEEGKLQKIRERFDLVGGMPNLFVLKEDKFQKLYGEITTLAQTFVDLWNNPSWQAKDFTKGLEVKIDELHPVLRW